MFGFNKDKAFVGLDIGSHAVKVLELDIKKKGKRTAYSVARVGFEPLPHDAIVEGQIIDAAAVAETIRTAFDKAKITTKDVVISIAGNSVIIKKIALPAMESEELAESIIWEAKHNIPYPYEETNVDYAILRPPAEGGDRGLEILLVAVKKEKVAAYANVLNQARKNLVAIEVDAFALYNALEINYPEEFAEKAVALVNIGASITTVVIIDHGAPQLFRDLSIGGSYFAENIRKDLNVGPQEADNLLKGLPSRSVEPFQIEAVLAMNVKGLIEEVEKTFSFFQAENKRENRIEHIFLAGGVANLHGVVAGIEEKFGVKTTLFDPFRHIHYNEKKLDRAIYQEMAPMFGVVTGLATRTKEK
jgi:type IV pilus assembly protein PilM